MGTSRFSCSSPGAGRATACVLCSHNCGLRVEIADGHITQVRPDPDNPITRGYICNKGYSIDRYVHHDRRVRQPLRRTGPGRFEPITWDQAVAEIAGKLTAIRARHPSRSIGLVGAGGQGNHLSIAYAVSFLHGLGSPMWFNSLAQEKTQHSLLDQWMFGASPMTWLHADDHATRYLLMLGSNPRISHRGHNATEVLKAIADDPGRTLVVVDPRRSETARQADRHVRLRPGSDCYFLLGMLTTLVRRGLCDARFVTERTAGHAALCTALRHVDPGAMAARCGVPASVITEVAEGFARSAPASIVCDLGVEQSRFSTLNAYLIRAILAVTGNLGREGSNVFYETFNPPDPVALESHTRTAALVSGTRGIRALSDFEMFSPSLVPEEVLADHPARLRALIVEGANPLVSYADTERWRAAMRRLDLLVVIDPAMTETAELAHYVLPTPVGYEKWEISLFPKHVRTIHAQLRPPVLPRQRQALPEPEIYARLARAMRLFPDPPRVSRWLARLSGSAGRAALVATSAAAALIGRGAAVQSRLLFWMYDTLGAQLPDPGLTVVWLLCLRNAVLRRRAVLRALGPSWHHRGPVAIADELLDQLLAHPEGTAIAHLDLGTNLVDHVRYRDGRIRIAPHAMLREIRRALDAPDLTDREFPLVLSAGLRTPWTANTLHRDPAWRKGKGPHCAVSVSPDDAAALGVAAGDAVVLRTRRGQATLPVAIDARLAPGHVSTPNGFGLRDAGGRLDGANINELTAIEDRDPFTACPHHKCVPCRIEPVPRSGEAPP